MAILLQTLYQETRQQYRLNLIAGENGMHHTVNWVYMAEDIGNASFLKGGELIISTGFAASRDQDFLLPFISTLIRKETCGLILNLGKYITEKDITPEIISLCNEHQFPLLTIPWEIYLSDLSQDYCNRIFEDRQNSCDLTSALKAALREEKLSPYVQETLSGQNYLPDDSYCVALLEFSSEPSVYRSCLQYLHRAAVHCVPAWRAGFISFEYGRQTVFIWHNTDYTVIDTHSEQLISSCTSSHGFLEVHMGISSCCQDIFQLKKLFQEASAALTMAKSLGMSLYHSERLGCFQILSEVKDKEVLRRYYKHYIGPLEEYDKTHSANYLETLECYLRFNQHLSQTAEAMICHKNTIHYRIGKIRDLLHTDLCDGETRFQLQLAIHIRNYLKIFG